MPAPAGWPARRNEAAPPGGDHGGSQAGPWHAFSGQGPAHAVIREMASLLRDTRASMVTDGCLLGAVTIGLALGAGLSARAPRPSLAGIIINVGLLGGILGCWLAAVVAMAWAGRPVLNALSEVRWRTGAPVDPRPRWVLLPPTGADPADWSWDHAYLLLGAARLARYRMRFADGWTYLTGGCFLAWTVIVALGW